VLVALGGGCNLPLGVTSRTGRMAARVARDAFLGAGRPDAGRTRARWCTARRRDADGSGRGRAGARLASGERTTSGPWAVCARARGTEGSAEALARRESLGAAVVREVVLDVEDLDGTRSPRASPGSPA
jgi:hypothetical protein